MILIAGLANDPIVQHIFKESRNTEISFAFLNQEHIGGKIIIDEEKISSQGWTIYHDQIQAVINRLVGTPKNPSQNHISQLEKFIYYLDTKYPEVLNRPSSGLSNLSKPKQLSMLKLNNLLIPNSFICAGTQPPKKSNLIYKSISSVRSIVRNHSEHKKNVKEPVLFQERCFGNNVRVHCLATNVESTLIFCDEIDYRYNSHKLIHRYKIPQEIANECIEINRQLKLTFSGIDLIKSSNDWYLLEVNPAPGFAFFEKNDPNKSISKMLFKYLTKL